MPTAFITITACQTPVGELLLGSHAGQLVLCDWRYRKMRDQVDARLQRFFDAAYTEGTDPVLDETRRQLDAYFDGALQQFDLPLGFAGSAFQQSVWQALCRIPYGQTASYLDLSCRVGNEKAVRAVAAANGANAISIIVPCHRIIGSDGSLTGYAGGLPAKKRLLSLEGGLPEQQNQYALQI